ncbi:MAG: hypothetical protein NTX63_00845 [Candidatus Peregrinibacteria bacterium]|nr:hypothetical protein [Candidatus Peregrinibacteria bacterium]
MTLTGLKFADEAQQLSIFDSPQRDAKSERMYTAVDALVEKMGRHTIYLGGSMKARAGNNDPAQYDQQVGKKRHTF